MQLRLLRIKGKLELNIIIKIDRFVLKVSDTGVGIAEDQLKLLGTPFFSTKSEGTGLGLTQVFTTIHEHGGNISVQSTVGKGTTFFFIFNCLVNKKLITFYYE